MKKKLIIITQWFDPEPTSKGLNFALELQKQGFSVEVMTGIPNYPGGKIYSGYKIKFIQKELIKNIIVTRIPLYPSHGKSSLGRILNYISFSVSIITYGFFIARNADIVYVYHPPLTVGIAACLLKKIWKFPIVYDIQDIWPDSLKSTGVIRKKFILKFISYLCSFVYKNVNAIVVISPGFKQTLIDRGVHEKKINVIYNWTNEISIPLSKIAYPDNIPKNDYIKIMYAGNVGKAQALESIIDTASLLISKTPNVCFIILGSGIELNSIQNYSIKKQAKNVYFLPFVSMNFVKNYLQSADILLVHLKADPLFKITIPSKTQAYMASGRPILMAVEGDAAALIESAQCGLTARSEDPADIADKLEKMIALGRVNLNRLGKNGMIYYQTYLSLEVGVRKYSEIFRLLLDDNSSH